MRLFFFLFISFFGTVLGRKICVFLYPDEEELLTLGFVILVVCTILAGAIFLWASWGDPWLTF
jgi:hypothetical protein